MVAEGALADADRTAAKAAADKRLVDSIQSPAPRTVSGKAGVRAALLGIGSGVLFLLCLIWNIHFYNGDSVADSRWERWGPTRPVLSWLGFLVALRGGTP